MCNLKFADGVDNPYVGDDEEFTGGCGSPMPKPDENHEKLTRLAGTWTGEETMHPSPWLPDGGKATATVAMRADLDGFVLITDYVQRTGEQTTYAGHGVYTVEPGSGEVVLHWFDSLGGQLEQFRGGWIDEMLIVQSKTQMGYMRLTYDFSQPDTLKNAADTSPDGESWTRMFEGLLTRG